MTDILEYKGYHTKINFISESGTLRGKVEGINDYVDFETENASDVENEFHKAVDDYLDFCKEVGKEPEKEYRGCFNVRIDSSLHKKLAIESIKFDESINSIVEQALYSYFSGKYI